MSDDARYWERVNYLLEQLKQEGDFDFLQAFEFLLDQSIAWRAYGTAFRNLYEHQDAAEALASARRARNDYALRFERLERAASDQFYLLRDIHDLVKKFVGSEPPPR